MCVHAVMTDSSDEAVELFFDRRMAELTVENRDRGEPERASEVWVEPVELEASAN